MISSNEAIAHLKKVEERISQDRSSTIEMIKRIPHLPCAMEWDVERALQEVHSLNSWSPHKLHPYKGFKAAFLKHHEASFEGACVIDYQKYSDVGMLDPEGSLYRQPDAQIDEQGRLKFFVTDAGEKTPYIISQLRKISPYVNRSRIIRTPPGGGIPWHSHHNNVYKLDFLRLCIFNIPLQTSEDCIHSVRDHRNPDAPVYTEHYQKGSTYLFNSWHDHEFWNNSPHERITIIPYFNFTDEVLLDFIETNIQQYRGPLIDG